MVVKCVICGRIVSAHYNQLYSNSWLDVARDEETGKLVWVCSKECEDKWCEED